jgi:hypothetical protein
VQTTVHGLQHQLRGTPPSVVLQHLAIPNSANSDLVATQQANILELSHQLSDLLVENAGYELKIAELNALIASLQRSNQSPNGFTMQDFLGVLVAKMRRSYGWKIDYITASHTTPECVPVENETIQAWQKTDKVPEWAIVQIDKMVFRKRRGSVGPTWTDDNQSFLIETCQQNPALKYKELAQICTRHFGRTLTENGIKGKVDRLRKTGLLD